MAFTNTPDYSTQQLKSLPIYGGQTIASEIMPGLSQASPTYQGLRYINCYPKRLVLKNTDDKWVLTKCPPIVPVTKSYPGSGSDKITAVSSDGELLWKGKRLYRDKQIPQLLYTHAANIYVETMFQVTNPSGPEKLYAGYFINLDTSTAHSYTYVESTNTFTASPAIPFGRVSPGKLYQTEFYNGRLYIIGVDNRIYNTPAGNYTSWSTTDFIVPEIVADNLVAISIHKNYLVAFSTQSIEFFHDQAIEIGSPLARQESYTKLIGISLPENVGKIGDLLFFIGYEDRVGNSVYQIENLEIKKISNFYVDSIINNEKITGTKPGSIKLNLVDLSGDSCLFLSIGSLQNEYFDSGYIEEGYIGQSFSELLAPFLCYSTDQNLWFDYVFSDSTGYRFDIKVVDANFYQLSQNSLYQQWLTFFASAYQTNGDVNFYKFDKNYNSSSDSTAEVVFDSVTFGVNNWKHIRYVDAIGDFGNNTVGLSWTFNPDYSNWTPYVSKTAVDKNAIRWFNLGRARKANFRLKFAGKSNIMLEEIMVAYNLGTV